MGFAIQKPDVRIKGPGRLLPAFYDKYRPVPSGGPGAQGRGQTWARLLEGDIHPATGSRPGEAADQLETLTSSDRWPFPTYSDLLFSV